MKKNKIIKNLLMVLFFVLMFVVKSGIVWASSEGGAHGKHWLKADTWKVLNFGILAIALIFILRKPAGQFFSSRVKNIEDEINELEQKKADAQKQLVEYKTKFKDLDQECKQIVEDHIKQGEKAGKRIIEQAHVQAEKLEDIAKRNIEQEFKKAKSKVLEKITQTAMERAEDLIKTTISPDDQDRLVHDYLKKVAAL